METPEPSLDRLAAELAMLGERLADIGSELRTIQLDGIPQPEPAPRPEPAPQPEPTTPPASPSTTGPDVWTRFFDLRRCQPGVPGDQAFLLDLAL